MLVHYWPRGFQDFLPLRPYKGTTSYGEIKKEFCFTVKVIHRIHSFAMLGHRPTEGNKRRFDAIFVVSIYTIRKWARTGTYKTTIINWEHNSNEALDMFTTNFNFVSNFKRTFQRLQACRLLQIVSFFRYFQQESIQSPDQFPKPYSKAWKIHNSRNLSQIPPQSWLQLQLHLKILTSLHLRQSHNRIFFQRVWHITNNRTHYAMLLLSSIFY